MKLLITGGTGQLGQALCKRGPFDHETDMPGRDVLDITDLNALQAYLDHSRPDRVINAAAYTAVDQAETDKDRAYAVNHTAVAHLAQACVRHGVPLIHISTDFVFDGRQSTPYGEADVTNPLSVYGASKQAGEQAALGHGAAVVRTSWLYGPIGRNFLRTMLWLLGERDSLGVVADQIGTPTLTDDLADFLWMLALSPDPNGLWHFSNAGVASWYDFAIAIQEEALGLGLLGRTIPIEPLRTEQYPTPAIRPAYSVLDKRKAWTFIGQIVPHWRVSLRTALHQLKDTHNG